MIRDVSAFPKVWLPNFMIAALGAIIVLAASAQGQALGGTYADVKNWAVSYRIVIKTPDGCCTVESEETTEGEPDWKITYHVYREVRGVYILSGPHLGFGMPDNRIGGDNAPPTGINREIYLRNLANYVGWQYAGPEGLFGTGILSDGTSSILHAKIDDSLVEDQKNKECTTTTIHVEETSEFDEDVRSKFGHSDFALDLLSHKYTIDLSNRPVNPGDDMKLVKMTRKIHKISNDPSETPDKKTTDVQDLKLNDYLGFVSKTFSSGDIKYQGPWEVGKHEVSVCIKEPVTRLSATGTGGIGLDIMRRKTVSVIVQFTIKEGKTAPSLDASCN